MTLLLCPSPFLNPPLSLFLARSSSLLRITHSPPRHLSISAQSQSLQDLRKTLSSQRLHLSPDRRRHTERLGIETRTKYLTITAILAVLSRILRRCPRRDKGITSWKNFSLSHDRTKIRAKPRRCFNTFSCPSDSCYYYYYSFVPSTFSLIEVIMIFSINMHIQPALYFFCLVVRGKQLIKGANLIIRIIICNTIVTVIACQLEDWDQI